MSENLGFWYLTFVSESADDIWSSVTGVSNQGRKRGRASRNKLMQKVNLSKGWRVGDGKTIFYYCLTHFLASLHEY